MTAVLVKEAMDRFIKRRVVLPVPRGEAWAAISESDRLGTWFGAEVELDLVPGGRARFRWPDGTERGALVELVEPSRRLRFRWLPFERLPDGAVVRREATRVELTLDDAGDGTLLTAVEAPLLQELPLEEPRSERRIRDGPEALVRP
jgi:uncharacterized protein YndB with AHSA1/START domain